MKEATGELNMTVVTIIAIGAIVAFFWILWPQIQNTINAQWEGISNCPTGMHQNADGSCVSD